MLSFCLFGVNRSKDGICDSDTGEGAAKRRAAVGTVVGLCSAGIAMDDEAAVRLRRRGMHESAGGRDGVSRRWFRGRTASGFYGAGPSSEARRISRFFFLIRTRSFCRASSDTDRAMSVYSRLWNIP